MRTMILKVNSSYSAYRPIISYTVLALDPQLQNGGNRDNTSYTSLGYGKSKIEHLAHAVFREHASLLPSLLHENDKGTDSYLPCLS